MQHRWIPVLCFFLLFAATVLAWPGRSVVGQSDTGNGVRQVMLWDQEEKTRCGSV